MANLGPLSSNTNDPYKANARVFIGNLPTDKVEKSLLFTVFKKYGEITGVSVHKGFAFVQYTCEADAREAVNGEHGQDICGSYVDCKVASEGRGSAVNNVAHTAPKHRTQTSALSRFTQHQRPESPPAPSRFQHENSSSGIGRSYDSHHSSKQHNSSSYHDQSENTRAASGGWIVPGAGGAAGGLSLPRESSLVRYQAEISRERPFDCLVISTDKSLSDYVEYVTGTLKTAAGILCHVITFPANSSNNSVAGPHLPGSNVTNCETKRLVEDVARLGCCALTVGPVTFTNSVQRSLSVNVHYDHVIEEHRNMPLQDAIHLIVNSYSQYSNQLRTQQISPSALIAYPASALLPLIANSNGTSSTHASIPSGASSSSSQKLTNSSEKANAQKLGRNGAINDYSASRDSRKSSSGRPGRNYRDRSDREDSPEDYDDEYSSDKKFFASTNGDDCMPPTCKRPAKLNEVIKHILISAEKTGAVPLISNDEIDQAIEVLRSARKPSKDGGDEESKNASSTNATTNGTSGPVSAAVNGTSSSATGAIQVPGHAAQLVNLVAAIPPSAPDLSVSQSNNAASMTTNPPNYVGSAAATVLNAGAALTYVATPATLVTASPAQVTVEPSRSEVESSIDTNSRPPAAATVMPSAAFIHPQTTATIIGPATPCFIHDQAATATLQYHATQQAAPPSLQQNQTSIPNGANQMQASVQSSV